MPFPFSLSHTPNFSILNSASGKTAVGLGTDIESRIAALGHNVQQQMFAEPARSQRVCRVPPGTPVPVCLSSPMSMSGTRSFG